MAKAFSLFRIILVLLIGFGSANAQLADVKRKEIVKVYQSQVGIKEHEGNNAGYDVEKYLYAVGLGRGQPWCAAFVSWTYQQCAISAPKSGYCPAWFPAKNLVYSRTKNLNYRHQPGDVFGIYFPEKRRIAHEGFVQQWTGSYAYTVEGNTNQSGSRDGDGVYYKKRLKRQVYAISRWIKQ